MEAFWADRLGVCRLYEANGEGKWPKACGIEGLTRMPRWIVCQIGAREHYALARALHHNELLEELVTDAWAAPGSGFDYLPGEIGIRLRDRFDENLAKARICQFTSSLILFEFGNRLLLGRGERSHMDRRNRWFQKKTVRYFRTANALCRRFDGAPIIFAYAYAARDILHAAREAGATTILGQIDGGPAEERLVASVRLKYSHIAPARPQAPNRDWVTWREECDLADRIVVNSRWSRDLLIEAGIEATKLRVVPVIYERRSGEGTTRPKYPLSFERSRPLRVLFLGGLIIRKGVVEALQAAESLRGEPVEFWFVGVDPDNLQSLAKSLPNVKWNPAVPRKEVERFYRDADVFLFPTHSDGFGITQLEAQDWGLPVIASQHCGAVVEHGSNGLIIDVVSADAIVRALQYFLQHPQELTAMSGRSSNTLQRFTGRTVLPLLLQGASGELSGQPDSSRRAGGSYIGNGHSQYGARYDPRMLDGQ